MTKKTKEVLAQVVITAMLITAFCILLSVIKTILKEKREQPKAPQIEQTQPKPPTIAPKPQPEPKRKMEKATPAQSDGNGNFKFAMTITKSDILSAVDKVEIKKEEEKERGK